MLLFVLGCENPEPLSPDFHVAGNSGCYIVEIEEFYDWSVGHGVLTGDLEGTTHGYDFGGKGLTGKAFHETYTADWRVTASTVIPQLAGKTLQVVAENDIYPLAPGQAPIYRLNGRMRIVDDEVRTGNLTSHGTLEFGVGIDITYNGPICL
jgi:hypothetical protein